MPRSSSFSLRFRLFLIVLLAIVPAFGFVLKTGLEIRQHEGEEAQRAARSLARVAASDQTELIDDAEQILAMLAQVPAVRHREITACNTFFAELLKLHHRAFTGFTVTKPDGEVICSAPALTQPVNFADREWFQRAIQTREFTVGDYQIGRLSGKTALILALPILDAQGQLESVVTTGLDLSWLNQLAAQVELPEGTALTVIDRNATILARYPYPDEWVGKAFSDASIVKTVLAQNQDTAETRGVDGISRLYGFARLGDSRRLRDSFVFVGIPTPVAYEQANRTLLFNLVGMLLVALLTFAFTFFYSELSITRRVEALVNVARRLSSGDWRARSRITYGFSELSVLARAFDQMAESLEQREVERQLSEEILRESAARYRRLFEESPISLWEEDFSDVNAYVDHLRDAGVTDLRAYFENQPEAVAKCVALMKICDANQAAIELYDAGSKEELLARVSETFTEKSFATFREELLALVEGKTEFQTEGVTKTLTGENKHVVVRWSVAADHGKTSGRVLVSMTDITERKTAEAELVRLRKAVVTSGEAIFLTDREGIITFVNPAFTQLYGYAAEDVVGKVTPRILKSGQMTAGNPSQGN